MCRIKPDRREASWSCVCVCVCLGGGCGMYDRLSVPPVGPLNRAGSVMMMMMRRRRRRSSIGLSYGCCCCCCHRWIKNAVTLHKVLSHMYVGCCYAVEPAASCLVVSPPLSPRPGTGEGWDVRGVGESRSDESRQPNCRGSAAATCFSRR